MRRAPSGSRERGRLSKEEAAQLGERLASLTSSGLPLPSGLRAMAEELPAGRLRRVLISLADELDSGQLLAGALLDQRPRLPAYLRGLVEGSSRTGNLGSIMGRFVAYADLGNEIRRRLWTSLIYPCVAAALAVAVGVFVCVALVPSFVRIYRDFGLALSAASRATLEFAAAVKALWEVLPFFVGGTLGLFLLYRLALDLPSRKSLACRVPLFGPVWRWATLAEYFHLLGLFVESEVALPEALRLAGEGAEDAALGPASAALAQQVEAGQSLSVALPGQRVFPAGIARILAWAEEHQSLAVAMHMLGDMCEAKASTGATFAAGVLGVVSALLFLGVLGLMASAVFLPMITFISRLSG